MRTGRRPMPVRLTTTADPAQQADPTTTAIAGAGVMPLLAPGHAKNVTPTKPATIPNSADSLASRDREVPFGAPRRPYEKGQSDDHEARAG